MTAPQPAQPVDVAAVGDGDLPLIGEAWIAAADHGSLQAEVRRLSEVALFNLRRSQTAERALADERRRVIEPFEKLAAQLDARGSQEPVGCWYVAERIRFVLGEIAGRAGSGEATHG